jgi:hypothetical protein
MRRIEAKRKANYWCEEQFWCKVPELHVHCAIALCSEINWPKEQAPGPVSTSNSIFSAPIADLRNQGPCKENRGTFGEEGNAKARTKYYVTLLAPRARFPIWRTLVGPL